MTNANYYKVALLSVIATKMLFPEQNFWYHIIVGIIFGLVADYRSSGETANEL